MNKVITINCLADTTITRHAIMNELGFYLDDNLVEFFRRLKNENVQLNIRSLFNRIARNSPFNSEQAEQRISLHNGLFMLRLMVNNLIEFNLIDSRIMIDELGKLKNMSPPLYEICRTKLINKDESIRNEQ